MGAYFEVQKDCRRFALGLVAIFLTGVPAWAETDASHIVLEWGVRYWLSTGSTGDTDYMAYDAGNGPVPRRYFRMNYDRLGGNSGEVFFRVENPDSGWFVKGNLGGGVVGSGMVTDESFLPFVTAYSRTVSSQHGGSSAYLTVDVGRDLWRDDRLRFGAYAGYGFQYEGLRAFGRVQTASNPTYRLDNEDFPALASYQPAFTQADLWHSGRLGITGRLRLIDRLMLNADAAFTYSYLDGKDHHIESYSSNPLPIHGFGPGGQFEVGLDYPLMDNVSVGIGGRYWTYRSDAAAYWNRTYGMASAGKQSADVWSRRYGVFAQLSMKFDYRVPQADWFAPAAADPDSGRDVSATAADGATDRKRSVVWDFGVRYWRSSGSFGYNLYSAIQLSYKNSRLTYDGLDGDSAEAFFRVEDMRSGWFAKGLLGGGFVNAGRLADEDFVTSDFPVYSRTVSSMHSSKLADAGLDVGHEIWRSLRGRLGAFAGYRFYRETANVFGCTQTASSDICSSGDVSPDLAVLAQEDNWHSVRTGLSGRLRLIDKLHLDADAAFAYSFLRGEDHHILRTTINPLSLRGEGPGGQFEAILSYPLTQVLDIGVGGRYWLYKSNGRSMWGKTAEYRGEENNRTDVWSRRYGVFLQLSMRFDVFSSEI